MIKKISKELEEEINFIKENSTAALVLLTISGILPSLACGILFKIFGL